MPAVVDEELADLFQVFQTAEAMIVVGHAERFRGVLTDCAVARHGVVRKRTFGVASVPPTRKRRRRVSTP
jgi:hypothetical protein